MNTTTKIILKYFSMFSGIGGFELGIQRVLDNRRITETSKLEQSRNMSNVNTSNGERWRPNTLCIGYSEIDKYAIQTYEKHFGGHKNYGNATDIKPEQLPDFDILVGGFPCQAFSIAGKRRGFEDTRGTLFFEIARVLKRKQPRMFLLENVKGLLNHDKGETFTTILQTIDELGYDAEWQVLNSKHFGVPQNRERVFIIGHLRGKSWRQIFPIRKNNKESNERKQRGMEVQTAQCVRAGLYKMGRDDNYIALTEKRTEESKKIRKEMMKGGKDWSPRRGKELVQRNDNIGNSLTSCQSKEHLLSNRYKIRRLTPIECERLQGFPDNWTEGVSDTQRYKQLGNAVTVNVIEEIMKRLL